MYGPCTMFGLCWLIDEAYVWTMLDVGCVGLCWMLNVLDLMYVWMLNECVCRCGHLLCEILCILCIMFFGEPQARRIHHDI